MKIISLIGLILAMALFVAGANNLNAQQSAPQPPISSVFEPPSSGFDPIVQPGMRDLPVPGTAQKAEKELPLTGIIKNKTRYDVSVPSANSGATLIIPAKGFIEYIAYESNFDLTVYHQGKPFYCLKINAHPKEYAYMCKQYDFIAEIVKSEPAAKAAKAGKYRKMKRAIKKPIPCPEEEQGTS